MSQPATVDRAQSPANWTLWRCHNGDADKPNFILCRHQGPPFPGDLVSWRGEPFLVEDCILSMEWVPYREAFSRAWKIVEKEADTLLTPDSGGSISVSCCLYPRTKITFWKFLSADRNAFFVLCNTNQPMVNIAPQFPRPELIDTTVAPVKIHDCLVDDETEGPGKWLTYCRKHFDEVCRVDGFIGWANKQESR